MQKINFEAGTQLSPAKVTIDNVDYEVTPSVWEGKTPLSPFVVNKMQDNIEEAINNVQALPIGGTTGQVLTKNSETDGDVKWSTVEGNEVYIGNEADAPATAKIVIDEEETGWEDEGEIYSTTERRIGTWIDGKPLYRKVVNVGQLQSTAGGKFIDFNYDITICKCVKLYGYARSNSGQTIPLPYSDCNNVSSSIMLSLQDDGKIRIFVGIDRSMYTECCVTLEYTKTTDTEGV